MCIPNNFRGVMEKDDASMFATIIERNAPSFVTVYRKAEHLFKRLRAVLDQFRPWVVLGQLGGSSELESLIEQQLNDVRDWEYNFKALKAKGREAEKLPRLDSTRYTFSAKKKLLREARGKYWTTKLISSKCKV